ncbi:MAG: winged helix-turn-helix domain-containing protein [Candidatus Hodarchaeota archaeon]
MLERYQINAKRRVKSLSEPDETQKVNFETVVKGTTLDIYFYLLRKKDAAGVREIQRNLGLSSPSVSSYHLEKLENLGVVQKNRFGNYEISKKIDISALKQFVMVGNYTLPRFFFYAIFISIVFGGYILFFLTFPLSIGEVFALIFGFFAVLVCWIETILSWRTRPF